MSAECRCDIITLKKLSSVYDLRTSCQCIDGDAKRGQSKLKVISDQEVDLDGTRYTKCKPA